MSKKECIAMLLAGGQGSRLGALTSKIAKPAVSFGGKYRIIDFTLSNCANSGIDTVGVLTQYRPYQLHEYVGSGRAWDLNELGAGVSILPPYATQEGGAWYAGTADAVTQNLDYIKSHDPEYVMILSGDALYRMDYRKMLDTHVSNDADLTVAVMPVPWEDASRFGILTTDENHQITKFTEKPEKPDSNLASMGIYIFTADFLIQTLEEDALDQRSSHDFGGDIIPKALADGKRLFAHEYHGFWKDVGTIASYHETSMDLLGPNPLFDLYDESEPDHVQRLDPPAALHRPRRPRRRLPDRQRLQDPGHRPPLDHLDRLRHRRARRRRGLRAATRLRRQERRSREPRHPGRERCRRGGRQARLGRHHEGHRRHRKRRRHRKGGMNR